MGPLRRWLLGVVLTAFAAGLAEKLSPAGRERAVVRLVGGLLLICAILRPLTGVRWEGVALETGNFSRQAAEQAAAYEKDQLDTLSAIIVEKTETYIWDKAYELGLDCAVSVKAAVGETGIPLPDSVTIAGPYNADLAACIEEEVGIPAEKQIWMEESAWSGMREKEGS